MADVFLSYARVDLAHAEAILARLQALGLSVFFDIEDGVRTGDAFPQVIANEVIAAKCVVACWSPEALSRPWCRRECFLALERGTLAPVAVRPVTSTDLREFVDISYEDLSDFAGQEKHFGWSQTLRGIAQSFERWAEKNASHPECEASLTFAGALRLASLKTRPDSSNAEPKAASARTELWEKLKKTNDVGRLLRFADSFPNSVESFHARDLVAAWEAFKKEFIGYDPEMHQSLIDYAARIPDLSAKVDEALKRDEDSVFSSMTGKKALELRKGHLDEVLRTIVRGSEMHYKMRDWPNFVDKWPNHPYADAMLELISQREHIMSLAEPMKKRLHDRLATIGELLALHEEAEEEAENSEHDDETEDGEQGRDKNSAIGDPWENRDLRNEPDDEVEFLDNLPEIAGISKWEQMQAAQRALLDFCDEKERRLAEEAERYAEATAQQQQWDMAQQEMQSQPAAIPSNVEVRRSTKERWHHVAWVICALLFIVLPIIIYWASVLTKSDPP